jgi:hypothetical protein
MIANLDASRYLTYPLVTFPKERHTMKASDWIDRAKAVKGWTSDYKAAQELGIKTPTISGYRANGTFMDESVALKMAHILELDPAVVLADQAMERAKDDEARSAWANILAILHRQEKAPDDAGASNVGGKGGIRTHGTLRYA